MQAPLRRKVRRKCPIYGPEERDCLRRAARFNAQVMDFIRDHVKAGVTTRQLDRLVEEFTHDHGHTCATKGYKGYPASICTSVNEVVCHGIPNDRPLKEGDIVNVDLTSIVDGWYGDQSETFLIGEVSAAARELVQVTFDAMFAGIDGIAPFGKVVDIGRAIERFVRDKPYEIVREYQGHGIGQDFHQDPGIPHYVPRLNPPQDVIEPGMSFTIEPMLNAGTYRTFVDSVDGWTVRTVDLALSAQFEHQILMTENGPEILTLTQRGPQRGHRF
ncbi:Methionine aminopeptidase [Planctopirus ephydatiae]|uniref:Methionine aminopeptidase n=1 Tax=Planctopirus ephydatiae TaxID=2528019 RepID=A0A518GPZ1_9PLAN|nr:type I methionyl aminopeptidase [Planctopirus ephydatiae]QDV30682.1 Methionine aminopeptidase [Planctopirus ephydatiae]